MGNSEGDDKEKASSSKLKARQQFCCLLDFTCLATRSSKHHAFVYAWPSTQQALNMCLRINLHGWKVITALAWTTYNIYQCH